jgi:hypothetical protein
MDFVAHCERHAIATVTTDAAVAWAIDTTRSRDQVWWARRLMVVRIFALSFPPNAGHLRCGVSDLRLTRCGGSQR